MTPSTLGYRSSSPDLGGCGRRQGWDSEVGSGLSLLCSGLSGVCDEEGREWEEGGSQEKKAGSWVCAGGGNKCERDASLGLLMRLLTLRRQRI